MIALTGVGSRFSAVLLNLADQIQLLALFFAMCVSIILGMGMPTTVAYAVAASVIAPGVIALGVAPLTAHFFIFYFAVMSAITPPVALAACAGAALAGSDPMKTSGESFRIGLAAFIVPYMFIYPDAMLLQGTWLEILHLGVTAVLGVCLLRCAVQGWMSGPVPVWLRVVLAGGALCMIAGGRLTDAMGFAASGLAWLVQSRAVTTADLAKERAD